MSGMEIQWPHCGERRAQVRKNPRNQYEQQLAESLRGGRETLYNVKPKTKAIAYDWSKQNAI